MFLSTKGTQFHSIVC